MFPLPVLKVPVADGTRVRLPCVVRLAVPVVPRIVPVVPRMVLFEVPQLLPIAIVDRTSRINLLFFANNNARDREHFGASSQDTDRTPCRALCTWQEVSYTY